MERYENLGTVGEGSYGVVLKCKDKTNGLVVAIKKFLELESDRNVRKIASREIKILKTLRHENLVNLIEVFRKNRRIFLVFEFIERNLLEEIEKTSSGMGETRTREVIFQVCRGVDYMHRNNFIHRDLKPENILINKNGLVKLCDFGFARQLAQPTETYTDYVATRWYRSPELLVGDPKYGKPVDIWSIGVLTYEVLTAKPLFPGESDLDQLYLIVNALGDLPDYLKICFLNNQYFFNAKFPRIKHFTPLQVKLKRFSPNLIKFMMDTLLIDHHKRPSSVDLLKHAYFTKNAWVDDYLVKLKDLVGMHEATLAKLGKLQRSNSRTTNTAENLLSSITTITNNPNNQQQQQPQSQPQPQPASTTPANLVKINAEYFPQKSTLGTGPPPPPPPPAVHAGGASVEVKLMESNFSTPSVLHAKNVAAPPQSNMTNRTPSSPMPPTSTLLPAIIVNSHSINMNNAPAGTAPHKYANTKSNAIYNNNNNNNNNGNITEMHEHLNSTSVIHIDKQQQQQQQQQQPYLTTMTRASNYHSESPLFNNHAQHNNNIIDHAVDKNTGHPRLPLDLLQVVKLTNREASYAPSESKSTSKTDIHMSESPHPVNSNININNNNNIASFLEMHPPHLHHPHHPHYPQQQQQQQQSNKITAPTGSYTNYNLSKTYANNKQMQHNNAGAQGNDYGPIYANWIGDSGHLTNSSISVTGLGSEYATHNATSSNSNHHLGSNSNNLKALNVKKSHYFAFEDSPLKAKKKLIAHQQQQPNSYPKGDQHNNNHDHQGTSTSTTSGENNYKLPKVKTYNFNNKEKRMLIYEKKAQSFLTQANSKK